MPPTSKLTPDILAAALAGLEAQRTRLEGQIAEVRALMGRRGPGRPPAAKLGALAEMPARRRKRRKLSPEGRARIIAATKKRWAAIRRKAAGA
jgi:hypothetical protein